jgi:hypothetical protein
MRERTGAAGLFASRRVAVPADDFHRERRDNITYSSGPAQAALSTVTEFYFSDRRPM